MREVCIFCAQRRRLSEHRPSVVADRAPAEAEAKEDKGSRDGRIGSVVSLTSPAFPGASGGRSLWDRRRRTELRSLCCVESGPPAGGQREAVDWLECARTWLRACSGDVSSGTASFTTSPKGADCSRGKTFASSCSRDESLQETTLDFRDMAGEEFRLLFPFIPSLSEGEGSERVTLERGKTFSQNSQLTGFFPAVCPYSTTESGRPGATRRSTHDDWAPGNKFRAVCFVPTHTFVNRTREFHSSRPSRLDRNGALGPETHNGVFTTPLAGSNLRLLPSMPRRCDCAETYRLLSHCSPT